MQELKNKLNEAYLKSGLTEETLRLSQDLDIYIAREQLKLFEEYKRGVNR